MSVASITPAAATSPCAAENKRPRKTRTHTPTLKFDGSKPGIRDSANTAMKMAGSRILLFTPEILTGIAADSNSEFQAVGLRFEQLGHGEGQFVIGDRLVQIGVGSGGLGARTGRGRVVAGDDDDGNPLASSICCIRSSAQKPSRTLPPPMKLSGGKSMSSRIKSGFPSQTIFNASESSPDMRTV